MKLTTLLSKSIATMALFGLFALMVPAGAGQGQTVTAEDLEVTVAKMAPLHGLVMRGGGFGIVAVGPQNEPPPVQVMSGGSFRMAGELTSLGSRIRGPGRPHLRVQSLAGALVLDWPEANEGYLLEETSALAVGGSEWTNLPVETAVVNGRRVVTLPAPSSGSRFYRLRKP